jgi:L-threonylcarbamoyladenylate synthase
MPVELTELVAALGRGDVVVIPTDTVYGLAGRFDSPEAVQRIFEIKQRPPDKPLPVLAASVSDLSAVATFDPLARQLADAFWPGPLTLVLPRAEGFDADLGAGERGTVGVRVPEHELTRRLLEECGPLAVTSANRSGEPPATDAQAASKLFPELLTLDGGPGAGQPSTVVSLVGRPKVLRSGALEDAVHQVLRTAASN